MNNLLRRAVTQGMGLVKRIGEINSDVFTQPGLLKCEPVKLVLKNDAIPYSVITARRVQFPLLSKVEAEIIRMENEGIIEEVTEPTDWCAPIVPVLKKNRNIRICVDLKKLNEAVKRERYILSTLEDVASKLVGAKVFFTLETNDVHHADGSFLFPTRSVWDNVSSGNLSKENKLFARQQRWSQSMHG